MCGRFGRFGIDTPEALAEFHAAVSYAKGDWKRDVYNVKPTTEQPMVYDVDGGRRLVTGTWCWRRVFSKAPLINCRGEEAAGKRTWLAALQARRCVVPASLFYEWRPTDKQPFAFALDSREGFGIGGLWEETDNGPAFVLLTTKPNALVGAVHDRMPLILRREDEAAWTDPATDFDTVQDLIRPFPAQEMTAWPVSKMVSGIHNDGPDLIKPFTGNREAEA